MEGSWLSLRSKREGIPECVLEGWREGGAMIMKAVRTEVRLDV